MEISDVPFVLRPFVLGSISCAVSLLGIICGCGPVRKAEPDRVVSYPESGYRFPPVLDIAEIQVTSHEIAVNGRFLDLDFHAPKSSWPHLLGCLTPSQLDPEPRAWRGLGYLRITEVGGVRYEVDLFQTLEPLGAFAIGPPSEHRKYYRGGSATELRNTILAAFRDSRKIKNKDKE